MFHRDNTIAIDTNSESLSLVHELTLWNQFPMERNLTQHRYRRENLDPASSDVTDFVDSIREASPFLESGWGMGWGEGGGVENSRERELGLLCKIPSKQLF